MSDLDIDLCIDLYGSRGHSLFIEGSHTTKNMHSACLFGHS